MKQKTPSSFFLKNVYSRLKEKNLDGLILFSPANISYFANYRCRDSYLIIAKKKGIFITDFRYIEEAKKNLPGFDLYKITRSPAKTIAEVCKKLRLKEIGAETSHLTFENYKNIRKEIPKNIRIVPTKGIIEEFREIKNKEEIKKIRKAALITNEALKFIEKIISPGKRETEIAGELERYIRYLGAENSSFDIIVASGPNSSYPHHVTSQRKLRNNEPVLIDIGSDYAGYKSDLTKVFFLGRIIPKVKEIYDIVKEAQNKAIRLIKPGISINQIDLAARQYITSKGYGGFFGHNLGHGIGLEVHEKPHISNKETSKLKEGMVFTIEPAIYLPRKFGIRLEDMILVTKKGAETINAIFNKRN